MEVNFWVWREIRTYVVFGMDEIKGKKWSQEGRFEKKKKKKKERVSVILVQDL